MKIIRVLIVDSDARLRKVLSGLIGEEDGMAVAGSVDGQVAARVHRVLGQATPDVIVLGIDKMDSGEMRLFLELRKEHPRLPVIVMPRHDREGAKIALKSLKNGAVEYIIKTMTRTGSMQTVDHFMERMIPVIKAVPRLNLNMLMSGREIDTAAGEIARVSSGTLDPSLRRMDLLVIGGCLGGVQALYLLLSSLPGRLPVPVVIVQHMPKLFTEALAEDLNRVSELDVREAAEGSPLEAGKVFIAPGGYHTTIRNAGSRQIVTLNRGLKVKGNRPSIDILLESTGNISGNRVLVVYLSGGGSDGVEGAEVIDTAGGRVIIQNKRTSLLWDLPWKIEGLGIHEGSYPLERLGYELSQRLM